MLPIGALLGGYLGTVLGIMPTMLVGGRSDSGRRSGWWAVLALCSIRQGCLAVEVLPATLGE
jgi:hypothetical protein